jgi:hypothetical protein
LKNNAFLPFCKFYTFTLGFLLLLCNSCAKADATPSLADQVVGIYVGKILRLASSEVPLPIAASNGNTFAVRFEVSKATAADKVNLVFITNQKTNGVKSDDREEYKDLIVVKGKDNEILLTENSKTVATVKDKFIDISFEVDGIVASFIGERP